MMKDRILSVLHILRSGERRYSLVAYLFGALLPGAKSGAGPVVWLRGWPMPDVRRGAGTIELGHVALYPGVQLHCRGSGHIAIGDGSFLNRHARIFAGRQVVLRRNCMVSWQTIITDFAGLGPGEPFAPVVLEDEVWIGSRALILGGTRLGRGCVVAAGSVVQGEFPSGVVIAGKPAEVIS
jgi:acetyltransferase-like isoleucine patch superfamily enzyme